MILLSVCGFAYAHWSDTVQIDGTAKMAHIRMTIISYKNLTSTDHQKYSTITSELSPDGHMLTLTCDGLKPCWFIWIGLVLQNIGTLPANVKPPEYTFEDPNGFRDYFETKEYLYGPYPEETGFGKLEIWGKVKVPDLLRPDGTVAFETEPKEPPFTTEPTEKAVIWIWIRCKEDIPYDAQGKEITLYITIVDDPFYLWNINPEGDVITIEGLNHASPGAITQTKKIPLPGVRNRRYASYAFSAITLPALAYTIWALTEAKPIKEKPLKETIKPCEEIIVEAKEPSYTGKATVTMKTLEDLAKVSESLAKPILHYKKEQTHVFYVLDADVRYEFTTEEIA